MTDFRPLRRMLVLLLSLLWATTGSFAVVNLQSPLICGVSMGYDAAESPNSGYDNAPLEARADYQSALADTWVSDDLVPGFIAARGGVSLDSSAIRFSQSNVRSSLPEITQSMRANGWQGAPIDVVRMADGGLTTVDNTRLAAASLSGTPVQAVVRNFDDVFPAGRAGGNLQGGTWGEALMNRIGGQKPAWQRTYPSGSPFTGVHPSTPGFTP